MIPGPVDDQQQAAGLSAIEMAEAPLLSWGDTEISFDRDELRDIVKRVVPDADAEALLDELIYSELLFEVPYLDEGPRYRTRSAETLRLLTRIRQLFPKKNDPTGAWRTGPRLVRDYRYAIRPRRVPARSTAKGEALEQLGGPASQQELEAIAALLPDEFNLRGFQLRAAHRILTDLRSGQSRGVVVTAGTGGGKTLAFYLPALAHIAAAADSRSWVKALAIYPRNELLRDQLAGVYALARRLDAGQQARGLRPVRVGTLFQETPYRPGTNLERIGWTRRAGGYECPMLPCPSCGAGKLVWKDADRESGDEILTCTDCAHSVDESTFAITRRAMQRHPPDIMFCSAEMVNRTTNDLAYAPLIGVHAIRPPRFLLLDEIHTYEGTTGAQTAQLLRRWQHLVNAPVEVVGLSATLPNAESFLSELVGLENWRVTPVSVEEHELEDIGSEYVVALRHDPTTRTATLSTTIQALMCLARCLDPMDDPSALSNGVYGKRIFAFTDKLDVVNRLYADMSDAEGYTSTGKAKTGKTSLAALRNPHLATGVEQSERQRDGQSWDLPSILGHPLEVGPGVRVGRVSSQDPGIDDVSTIVTATASLEVGFDDDRAGAVLQHGAPTDMARFIQRKGRAGRPENMRPWTVVVLSDYGKDRRSYQAWDALVDPQAPPKSLPVRNRYVLRMHAVHALLDWLALRLRGSGTRLRFDLAESSAQQYYDRWEERVRPVQELLHALLEDPALQAHLQQHVADALRVPAEEAEVLLWHPPRPVIMGAVPTLLRRLETDWHHVERGARQDLRIPQVPLPDFVSRTLFESLESPDVDVQWPARFSDDDEASTVGLETLLREFAPGNASRRFGFKSQTSVHWVPVESRGTGHGADIRRSYPGAEDVGTLFVGSTALRLLQPHRVLLDDVPHDIGDRAHAQPTWGTVLEPLGSPYGVPLGRSEIGTSLTRLDFYLHVDGSGIDLSRGVHSTDVELPAGDGKSHRFTAHVFDEDERVALGTRFTADAAAIHIEVPDDLVDVATSDPVIERATRSSWFAHRMEGDPRLASHANRFQLEWVRDAVLATLAARSLTGGQTLEQAVMAGDGCRLIIDGLDLVLHTVSGQGAAGSNASRLRSGLEELARIDAFADAVHDVTRELLLDVDDRMADWLQSRYQATVATAVLEAAELLASEHASADCVVDVAPHVADADLPSSWLIERSPGGAGFLEELRVVLEEHPGRFARVVRTLLMPGVDARVDRDLVAILTRDDHDEIWNALANFREAVSPTERRYALGDLRRTMRLSGVAPLPATVSALIARVARPGSTTASDEAARELVTGWVEAENHLGFELDVRVWAALGSERLARQGLTLPGPRDRQGQLDAALSILWPRGWTRESDRLNSWNPFEVHASTFPTLVARSMESVLPHVRVPSDDGEQAVFDRLRGSGSCRVAASRGDEKQLARFLLGVTATPIDVGGLLAFAHIADVSLAGQQHVATLELREALGR